LAEPAREGNIYRIDLQDGKPAHYWVILNNPQELDQSFLTVSWTDRHNLPLSDVWPYDYEVGSSFRLSKPSVIALRHVLIKTQSWLDRLEAEFFGICTAVALKRARCNLFWYPQYVSAEGRKYANFYAASWNESCGPAPPR
jgi:hypothetical protein